MTIKNSTFTQNKSTAAKGGGGALLTWMGDVTVENCSFEGNAVEGSGGSGGAWYASMTAADINSCKVSNTYFGEILVRLMVVLFLRKCPMEFSRIVLSTKM